MPILGNSSQSGTLEEFYIGLTSNKGQAHEREIGKIMLDFIAMVNQTFTSTTLYGLTSHYHLIIQRKDNWRDDWFIRVYSYGDKTFQFEYLIPEHKSPWKRALIKGQADDLEEARNLLIIAMTETEGWAGNKELNQLYNTLKGRKSENLKFTLWLEFEEVDFKDSDITNFISQSAG